MMLLLIEKYIFYLFLFAIPFQTRKILWYSGWRFNEWQSISIYATDILLVVLVLFWISNSKFNPTVGGQNLKIYEYFLIIFLVISAISIKNSSDYIVSTYHWIKLA